MVFRMKNMSKLLATPFAVLLLVLLNATGTICLSSQDIDKGLLENQSPITRPSQEKENPINDVDVEMKIASSQRNFHYPEPIKLQVFLFGRHPVLDARVEATVTSPSGSTSQVPLSENILLGATTPESGSYVAIITDFQKDGRYLITIRADDNGGRAYIAGSRRDDKTSLGVGPFDIERLMSIQVSGYEDRPSLPPLRINTLYAEVSDEQCILLSWQVPLNIGRDGSYEIRYSHELIQSREDWARAELLHKGRYSKKGGETQSYRSCEFGQGRYLLAVISNNKMGVQSEISNNYIVVLQ